MDERRKEYASQDEFETDRRRMWKSGGWLVRTRVSGHERASHRGMMIPDLGSGLPWQFAAPIVALVAVVAFLRWRRRGSRDRAIEGMSVVYGRVTS